MNTPFGLGDLAYYLFRPFVYATDLIWGTDMRNCSVCKKRRKAWNSFGTVPCWVPCILLVTVGVWLISLRA